MEGSFITVLPLLILLFLGCPAMLAHFPATQQLFWRKLDQFWVKIWSWGESVEDMGRFSPLVKLILGWVVASCAAEILGKQLLNLISKQAGNSAIYFSLHYVSYYIFLLILQTLGYNLINSLKRIRNHLLLNV